MPTAYRSQLPVPSHLPFVPHAAAPLSLHSPRGSTLSAATVRQRPGEPGNAQEWQVPVQAVSQHTPSTQNPEAHSAAPPHGNPGGFGPQVLFWQIAPSSQSVSVSQDFVQAPAAQRNGWQFWTLGARQDPSPSQVPAVFSRFPVQLGIRHCVSRV